jgi:hypothetical protein
MTAEIAPKTSERSAVWVPYVVRRAERTFRKPVVPPGYRCRRRRSAAAPRSGTGHQWGGGQNRGCLLPPLAA